MGTWLDEIKTLPHFRGLTGVTFDEIAKAELALGVQFAQDYRLYLLDLGLCSVNGHEFTGICKSERLNVVSVTHEARLNKVDVPSNWYVVEHLGIDGVIAWQSSDGSVYFSSAGGVSKKIAQSLIEYARM